MLPVLLDSAAWVLAYDGTPHDIIRDLRRYIGEGGDIGSYPDWYPDLAKLARAARYLNCSALDLVRDPEAEVWTEWAYIASVAEEGGAIIRANKAHQST